MHRLAFLRDALAVGLIGGAAIGLLFVLALGSTRRDLLTPGNTLDVLSYSMLAHALLWAVHGALVGTVAAAVSTFVDGTAARSGRVAFAGLCAGAGAVTLWPAAWHFGVNLAFGVQASWVAVVVLAWIGLFACAYAAAGLVPRRFGVRARRALELAVAPAVVLLMCCAIAQWALRPRPREAPEPPAHGAPARATTDGPDVVLVVLDTLRADRLGSYGYERPTSPNLDGFAEGAARWEHCLSPAIWTLPAHASIFTGLFPSEHGADGDRKWLDDGFDTLAERLNRRGYETLAVSNNLWVTGISNVTQGFERVFAPFRLHHARGNVISEFLDKALYPASLVGPWLGHLTFEDAGGAFTNRLIDRWLDTREPQRPFFLFVNYMEPHEPYRPHRSQRRLFLDARRLADSYRPTWSRANEFSLLGMDVYTAEELRLLGDVYDAETRLVDDYFGSLLEILDRRVSLDRTLVIVTADHGENLGDHHLQGHTNCVYDTLARVPLIVRYPRALSPGRRDGLVQTTDIFHTVLDATGGPVDGRSLLRDPAKDDRLAIVERMAPQTTLAVPDPDFDDGPYRVVMRAARRGAWKLILGAGGREELYDVIDDPGEMRDRIAEEPEIAARLRVALDEWVAASRPYDDGHRDEAPPELDGATRRKLKSLGYLE